MGLKEDCEQQYEEFWMKILYNKDGSINKEKLMLELADYSWLMEAASKVYCHVTDNATSNVRVLPDVVIGLYEESISDALNEHEKEIVEEVLGIIESRKFNCSEKINNRKSLNGYGGGLLEGEFSGLKDLMEEIKEHYGIIDEPKD